MEKDERLAILNGLPKVELHRHLEGSLRLSTMLELGRKHGIDMPLQDEESLARVVTFNEGEPRTLANFLTKFHSDWYRTYTDVERVTTEVVSDAASEGIAHLELRFSPEHLSRTSGLQAKGAMQAVCESGQARAAEAGISICFLITLARERYDFDLWKEFIDDGVQMFDLGLAGIDLAGDEFNYPNALFEKIFRRAKDTGTMGISIHAGEGTSARQVASAVETLSADRIGHGLSAAEDEAVVKLLVERQVPLEMCPISNFQTGCIDELQNHPLTSMDRAGVCVTLNADDPTIHGSSLNHDYDVAVSRWGYTLQDLLRLEKNSVAACFMTAEERDELLGRVEAGYAESMNQGL